MVVVGADKRDLRDDFIGTPSYSFKEGFFNMENILAAIGNTPLLRLEQGPPPDGAVIYAKIERFNPGGSLKDRAALAMIEAAEEEGKLQVGGTVVEPVAGNTGVALALICRLRGYSLILTMPEDYMPERRYILECCGTQIETTSAAEGITGAIRRAREIHAEHPGSYMPDHFSNRVQVTAHRQGLVSEIVADLEGVAVDAVVGCVGTGSSLTALAEIFREQGSEIIAVDPPTFPHAIQGIGFGFDPALLNQELIDRRETVTDEEALAGFRDLAATTGLLAGLSSGAVFHVAKKIARQLGPDKNILTLFYDGGERYFSLREELQKKERL